MLHLAAYPLLVGSRFDTHVDAYTHRRCLLSYVPFHTLQPDTLRDREQQNGRARKRHGEQVIIFIYSFKPSVRHRTSYQDNCVYPTAT
jgi:hypothetical protein